MLSSINFNQAGFANTINRNQSFGDAKGVMLRELAEKGSKTAKEGASAGRDDLGRLLALKISHAIQEGSKKPIHPSLETLKPGTRLAVTA